MRRKYSAVRVLAAGLALAVSVGAAAPAVAGEHAVTNGSDGRPLTIPALQEWTPGTGALALKEGTKIVVSHRDAPQLLPVARLLAAELAGRDATSAARAVVNNGGGGKGDIVLRLDEDADVEGDEGYQLAIGRTATVTATTSDGAFNATRTVLQLLDDDGNLPKGTALDAPRYEERGLMVDIARMYFSEDWLKARIRDMAYLKLNTLHLHLTDDEGWGVESDLGVPSDQHLTKAELRELVAYAERYHVTVIPEIDMPAHLGSLLAQYPQYQLKDANGVASPTKIDFTIPGARELLKSIVLEYLPLFPGEYWHLGTDEYLSTSQFQNYPQLEQWAEANLGPQATAKDSIILFANEMNAFVRSQGKTARIWNDNVGGGTTIDVDTDVVIQYWTDSDSEDFFGSNGPLTPQTLLDQGYQVVNDSLLPTYAYPPGGQTPQIHVDYMYEQWSVERFYGYLYSDPVGDGNYVKYLPEKVVPVGAPGLRGSMLNLWNSGGTWTPEEAAADIFPRLRVMAQQTWNSEPLTPDYPQFAQIIEQVGTAD